MATIHNPGGGSVNVISGSTVAGSVVTGHWPRRRTPAAVDGRRWRVWVDHVPVTSPLAAVDAADEFTYQARCRHDAHVEIKPDGGQQW